jgi:uncharacterized membrane protein YhaH (DUF805 family)
MAASKGLLSVFTGRLGRKPYWLAIAGLPLIAVFVFVIIDPFDIGTILSGNLEEIKALLTDPFMLIIVGVLVWLLAGIHARRLHDLDRSAWWLIAPALLLAFGALLARGEQPRLLYAAGAFLALVPTAWLFAETGFRIGSEGANRFGAPAAAPETQPVKLHKPTAADARKVAVKGVLWSPLGFLIALPLQIVLLLLLPFRSRHAFFGFHGRIGRKTYWQLGVAAFAVAFVADIIALEFAAYFFGRTTHELQGAPMMKPVHLLFIGLAAWAFAALAARRLHDRNRTAWWTIVFSPFLMFALAQILGASETVMTIVILPLLLSAPFVLWFWVELGFIKGTQGPNRFGPDPITPTQPAEAGAAA